MSTSFKEELIALLQETPGDSYQDVLVALNSLVLCEDLCQCTQGSTLKSARSKTTNKNNYDPETLETMTKLAIRLTHIKAIKEGERQ